MWLEIRTTTTQIGMHPSMHPFFVSKAMTDMPDMVFLLHALPMSVTSSDTSIGSHGRRFPKTVRGIHIPRVRRVGGDRKKAVTKEQGGLRCLSHVMESHRIM